MKVSLAIATPAILLHGGGVSNAGNLAAFLIDGELDGFAIDFTDNSYALKTTSAEEKVLLQLGDEWRGFALDFTTNVYAIQYSDNAETLLGMGPMSQESKGFAIDFIDNSSAVRN